MFDKLSKILRNWLTTRKVKKWVRKQRNVKTFNWHAFLHKLLYPEKEHWPFTEASGAHYFYACWVRRLSSFILPPAAELTLWNVLLSIPPVIAYCLWALKLDSSFYTKNPRSFSEAACTFEVTTSTKRQLALLSNYYWTYKISPSRRIGVANAYSSFSEMMAKYMKRTLWPCSETPSGMRLILTALLLPSAKLLTLQVCITRKSFNNRHSSAWFYRWLWHKPENAGSSLHHLTCSNQKKSRQLYRQDKDAAKLLLGT